MVGATLTVKLVPFKMLVTVVPAAKTPVPLTIAIDIPTAKLAVVATVIVVPADDAPEET